MTVAALRRVGGVPLVATGEDRALIAALRRIDTPVRQDPRIRVTVSGRIEGRAPGGMADTIRRRMVQQDEYTDAQLEPAIDAYRRADFRRRVWSAWTKREAEPELSIDLQLPLATLDKALHMPFRGTAWAEIERLSPLMHCRRVRFVDLPQQIAYATRLLTSLSICGD